MLLLRLLRAGRTAVRRAGSRACSSGGDGDGQVRLTVKPVRSLADEPLSIGVSGLGPRQAVTLRARVLTEEGSLFISAGQFVSDGQGLLDTGRAPSLGGDYQGVAAMGLLWSLAPAPMERPYQRLRRYRLIEGPMYVDLSVFPGHSGSNTIPGPPLARERIERWYSTPGIRRIKLREGRLRGSVFTPPGKHRPRVTHCPSE